ncbi:MAG: hypothetical protein QF541_14315 [Lentisphaeria bacterium]|jgi:hypothetical protein|nr:hypothetical protein [Lentisphaeria bacterium]
MLNQQVVSKITDHFRRGNSRQKRVFPHEMACTHYRRRYDNYKKKNIFSEKKVVVSRGIALFTMAETQGSECSWFSAARVQMTG